MPMAEAAIPLPRADMTPPVTKMYLLIDAFLKEFFHSDYILGRIDTQGGVRHFDHLDLETGLENPKLFQAFGRPQAGSMHPGELPKEFPLIAVDADVEVVVIARPLRDRRPRKIHGVASVVDHDFHPVRFSHSFKARLSVHGAGY